VSILVSPVIFPPSIFCYPANNSTTSGSILGFSRTKAFPNAYNASVEPIAALYNKFKFSVDKKPESIEKSELILNKVFTAVFNSPIAVAYLDIAVALLLAELVTEFIAFCQSTSLVAMVEIAFSA
jgi:hypothetical protein